MRRRKRKTNNMEKKIKELSKPLVKYLEENCDPYTYVVVSMDSIKVMRTEFCTSTANRKNEVVINVDIDTKNVEETIRKLSIALKEANSLADELTSKNVGLEIDI